MKPLNETATVSVNTKCKEEYLVDDELQELITYIRSGKMKGNEENVITRLEMIVEKAKDAGWWSSVEYTLKRQTERDIARRYIAEERAEAEKQRARADAAEARADSAEARADSTEARADSAEARADSTEARADSAEAMLANLQKRLDDLKAQIK